MRTLIQHLLFAMAKIVPFVLVSMLCSCEMDLFKKYETGDPTLEISSITSNDGIVTIVGKVSNTGIYDLEYTGFCFNQSGNPHITENQILLGGSLEFSATIYDLESEGQYYFKAFAANGFGLSESEIVAFTVPYIGPPVVPCTITPETINNGGVTYSISSANASQFLAEVGNYGIDASCFSTGGPTVHINFHTTPSNGIYTTSTYSSFDNSQNYVYVQVHLAGQIFPVQSGGFVYVSNENNEVVVSFCDLMYTAFSSEWVMKGNVVID